MFTIYSADVTGNPGNCSYPHKHVILDEASLKDDICHDYVCAEYRNSYRNGDNFIGSDCLPVDCDNDHTEDPAGWKTPEDVMEALPGVTFAIHYSRYNMREKNGKPSRPKFHVLFPIDYVTDAALYSDMKKLVNSIFPYFDTKALDAARFFFGTSAADVALYPGRMNLTEFLEEDAFDDDIPDGQYDGNTVIPEGSRNATMSRFAGRVIKKYGDTEEAYQAFLDEAAKCVPPLEASELSTIWHSAQRFFARIRQQDGYVPPEVYNDPASYKPEDFSDVGQAEVLSKYFSKELRYSPATHFIRYSDHYWQESEPGAQAVAHELTRRQMKEAGRDLLAALEKLKNCGAQTILDSTSKSKAEQLMNDEQLKAYQAFLAAQAYRAFVIKRRDSKYVTATLKESHPMLEISPRDLDADCFALNTPDATYDLRLGMAGAREHSPEDFITKITSVTLGSKGKQIWRDCLDLIFQRNQELIDYVQMICGLAAIGKVYVEALIIAYGDGRNGKSTFLDMRIKSKIQQIDSLRELATSCTAVLSDMPRNPNHGASKVESCVLKIIEVQEGLKQIKFLSELFRCSSITEAIKETGIAETTAYRWMREDTEFKKELQNRKTQALDEVSTQMQIGFSEAVQELLDIIRNNKVSAQVKINAIDCLFRNARPIIEEVDILNRLQEVEARLQKEGDPDDPDDQEKTSGIRTGKERTCA